MSTNNFSFQNICVMVHDKVEYACDNCGVYQLDNDKCPDCGKQMVDNHIEDFYESDIKNWQAILAEKMKGFQIPPRNEWTDNDALIMGYRSFYRPNGELYATVTATYKSGYYAAACLDYFVDYVDGDNDHLKKLDAQIARYEARLVKLLKSFGTSLKKVAQLSNGEAIYQKE